MAGEVFGIMNKKSPHVISAVVWVAKDTPYTQDRENHGWGGEMLSKNNTIWAMVGWVSLFEKKAFKRKEKQN